MTESFFCVFLLMCVDLSQTLSTCESESCCIFSSRQRHHFKIKGFHKKQLIYSCLVWFWLKKNYPSLMFLPFLAPRYLIYQLYWQQLFGSRTDLSVLSLFCISTASRFYHSTRRRRCSRFLSFSKPSVAQEVNLSYPSSGWAPLNRALCIVDMSIWDFPMWFCI